MLVLSRRTGEKIVITDEIIVQVLEVRGDRVRIGVQAPGDIPVDRAEVHERRREPHNRERADVMSLER